MRLLIVVGLLLSLLFAHLTILTQRREIDSLWRARLLKSIECGQFDVIAAGQRQGFDTARR